MNKVYLRLIPEDECVWRELAEAPDEHGNKGSRGLMAISSSVTMDEQKHSEYVVQNSLVMAHWLDEVKRTSYGNGSDL